MGMTDDPDVATATSVLDYCVRRLALDFLSPDECVQLGIRSFDEEVSRLAVTAG